MTSDDVRFRTGITEELDESVDIPVKAAFDKATTGISESPRLAIIFPPLILKNAGDAYVNAWQKIIPNVPVFGSIATDDAIISKFSETIYNGKNYKTVMPFMIGVFLYWRCK